MINDNQNIETDIDKKSVSSTLHSSQSSQLSDNKKITHHHHHNHHNHHNQNHNHHNNQIQNHNNNKFKLYCGNCGKVGHTYKKCVDAIISLGIILYNTIQINNYYEIKFLLIQRRDSIGFIELLRGKYQEKDDVYLSKIIDIMTVDERNRALNTDFDDLLDKFIINKNNRHYKYEYQDAKEKFNRIKNSGKLKEIIDNSPNQWPEPEWGFPKGRRHLKENDLDCACREFEEETGYLETDYLIIHNVKSLEEIFLGTNKIRYKHNYFLAKVSTDKAPEINKNNKTQIAEIGNIGWFSLQEALKKIRTYHKEKINVLKKAYSIIRAEKTYFKEHIIEDDPSIIIH
jgi:8-oxo-dGTP pyrophosphatase MutT (NUDIX family)